MAEIELKQAKHGETICIPSEEEKIENNISEQRQLMSWGGLDEVDDKILIEILLRLPNGETATQCKLVCKRWNSLISTPYFISRFHSRHRNYKKRKLDFALLVVASTREIYDSTSFTTTCYALTFGKPRAQKFFSEFSFSSFIPPHILGSNFQILASCADLLFCSAFHCHASYVVCNPITRQWIPLPSPPPFPFPNLCRDTCAILRQRTNNDNNIGARFRALSFVCDYGHARHLYVDTYCSETGEWHRSAQLDCRLYAPFHSTVVAYKGKLHWFNYKRNLVAYDPFQVGVGRSSNCSMDVIDSGPELKRYGGHAFASRQLVLGVCQGILRVMWVEFLSGKLRVFDLKDYDSGQWTFYWGGRTRMLLSVNPHLPEEYEKDSYHASVVAFHPNNPRIVFLGICGAVVMCNLRKRQVDVAALVPSEFCPFSYCSCPLFILPWPTQISSPQQQLVL